jgi:adenylate cyclase
MMDSKSASDRKRPGRRVVLAWVGMTLLAVLLTLQLGDRMRRGVFDSWQRLSPRDLAASDVRVVMIDNQSVEFLGAWPWR